jgi:hypothetical protein
MGRWCAVLLFAGACKPDEKPPGDTTPTDPSDTVDTLDTTTPPTDTTDTTPVTTPTGDTGDTTVVTTGDTRLFDAYHVLVIPDQDGVQFMDNTGAVVFFQTWDQLVDGCNGCGGEGSSADGDGLLLSFTTGGGFTSGGVARIDDAGALDWRVDGFAFPHDAIRDPFDDTVIVPEAFSDAARWIAGDGSSNSSVRELNNSDDGWEGDQPNGADRLDYDGRTYLLESHRGGPGFGATGEISFWDITDPAATQLVWRFPPDQGSLYTPHGPILREWNGEWWLVWAHSDGGPVNDSSIGLAVTSDPTVLPAYVADLVPTGPEAPFIFVRGVELTSDGWLYITDSGANGGIGFGDDGRILKAPMPTLYAQGESGDANGDQRFEDLTGVELLLDGLSNPFEGWLWANPAYP